MAECKFFMKEQHIYYLLIYQFLGNWFNIVFLKSANIYDSITEFSNKIGIDNKLPLAVQWDLKTLGYKIGGHALGLLEKLVIGLCGES